MEKKRIKIQKVDFYTGYFEKFIKGKLEKNFNLEFTEHPDFLFYSVYGSGREHYQYENCVKIFWSLEGVLPDFNECDYAIGSYPMVVGDRYLKIPYEKIPCEAQDRNKFRDIDISGRKFCNFIYSNSNNGKGAVLRQEFCKQLMQYKHVDCPGKVLNNMKDAISPRNSGWWKSKLDFIKQYKFTIAFENVSMPGMITEKLNQAFLAGTIPIYWGDPYVTEIYNRNAFINCFEYASWDDVIEKIKELDNDDQKYKEMLLTPPILPDCHIAGDEEIILFLKEIIEKGNVPFEKDPLGWDAGSLASKQIEAMSKNLFYKMYRLQQKGIEAVSNIKKIKRK